MIIPGFSKYDITKDGVVTRVGTGVVVKPYAVTSRDTYKYLRVYLTGDDGQRHACNVLRLLAITYLDPPSEPGMVRAKDGDNMNVCLDNAEWVPYSYYTKLGWKRGLYQGRRPKPSCYNEDNIEDVLRILKEYKGLPVTASAVSNILDVPYTVVRYAMKDLIQRGLVQKTEFGFKSI